jgi:N6-adenosine-specific RNA methylase IME4
MFSMFHAIPAGMRFGAIYADPGIAFKTRSPKGETSRVPQRKYRCPPLDELKKLPVADYAAKDCWLCLWVPPRSVPLVEPLMEAWGFTFSSRAFEWVKTYDDGSLFFGSGYTTRKGSEDCWLGRRGNPQRKSKSVREVIVAPVREHSRKPDETYRRIEQFCDGPYLELFARQQWPNWTCVGDEAEKFTAGIAA